MNRELKLGICRKCHEDIWGNLSDGYGYYDMVIVSKSDGTQDMYHRKCVNKFKRMKFKRGN